MNSPTVCYRTTLLVILALISEVSVHNYDEFKIRSYVDRDTSDMPYVTAVSDEEYSRSIHSMFDGYRGDIGRRMVIETNAHIDTNYRTWKRNADLINSLLALPKGMNDAGR